MLVGYARVSTPDQSLNLQRDALRTVGCKRVFTDVAGGAGAERPGLTKALEYVRRGDTIVVWKLDRFGRSLRDLVESVTALKARRVGFRSLQEAIDTTTSGGRLVFHVFASLAEFERDLIRERTQAGLKAAHARGRMGGRPHILTGKRLELAQPLFNDPKNSSRDIAKTIGVSLATLYRYVRPPPPVAPASPAPRAPKAPAASVTGSRRSPSCVARGKSRAARRP
jgi:DNA invertase Pin-like site-specific DNA recombinase